MDRFEGKGSWMGCCFKGCAVCVEVKAQLALESLYREPYRPSELEGH